MKCYNNFVSMVYQRNGEVVEAQIESASIQQLAERVRLACIEAALEGYELAAMNGLCHEGAWEAAISAMQTLDVAALIHAELDDQNSKR